MVFLENVHYDFNEPKSPHGTLVIFFVPEMYLDDFRKLLHPPPTGGVVPGLTLHAVLHLLHTDLSPPTTVETRNNSRQNQRVTETKYHCSQITGGGI